MYVTGSNKEVFDAILKILYCLIRVLKYKQVPKVFKNGISLFGLHRVWRFLLFLAYLSTRWRKIDKLFWTYKNAIRLWVIKIVLKLLGKMGKLFWKKFWNYYTKYKLLFWHRFISPQISFLLISVWIYSEM